MRLLFFFLALHCTLGRAVAQRPFHRDISLTESGTPLRVNDLVADDLGMLWLATSDGLYRYNGRVATPEPPGSARRAAASLAYSNGTLFIGFEDGNVMALRGTKARRLFGASSSITCLLPLSYGLLIGTAGEGVALVRREGVYRLTMANGLSDDYVYNMALTSQPSTTDGSTKLLIGTDRGITVVSLDSGKLHCDVLNTANTPALRDNIVRVIHRMPGDRDAFFVGTQAGGHCQLTRKGDKSWEVLPDSSGKGGQINDALSIGRMQIIATDDGLHLNDGELCQVVLHGRPIYRILQGPCGNYYLATSDGLTAVTTDYLDHLGAAPPYSLRALSTLTTDRTGTLWFAQDSALYFYDTVASSRLRFKAPEAITNLYADAHNRLWIGTLGGGLLCREEGGIHTVANIESLRGGHILQIAGRGDTLWVSSLNGVEELYVPRGGSNAPRLLRHHGGATGAGSDYVYQMYPDRRGRLWMATDGAGIVMWDGTRYHRWNSSGFNPRVVYSVVEDAHGGIWAGTLEGGLLHWDGQKWRAFHRGDGLQSNTIFSLAALRDGSVVAVGEEGADQWLPESREFRQYSRRMGLHIDSFSAVLNAVTMDTVGNAIVPYEHGFLLIKPAARPHDFRPQIVLRAVELFLKPIDTGRYQFAPDENGIGFRWEGIHFAAPERLRYRYRLRGYNESWVATGDEAVTFLRLPAGNYTFEVEAALGENFYNAARASYPFQIAAPIWRRWWFWALAALVIATIFFVFVKRRDYARQRLAAIQQARLRAEYEGLKSQVNPHFLFNSLNTLVSLIEENPTAAAHYTEQLSDLYRDTLAFRSRDVVTLAEEWDVLQKYLHIQQSRFGDALRVEAHMADEVLQKRKIIPLALQLLVENAIKHNEVSRANPLTISISATDEWLTVRNALRAKASRERGTGIGLENIRNRYALLTSRQVSASRTGGYFSVTLPLL